MLLLIPFLVCLPSTASPILYSSSMYPCPMCIHLHFPKLNNICHFSDHLTNLSRSSCKLCLSVSFVTFLNTFVSSANLSTLLDMSSSRSFIYVKNNIGLNTDPCGTPLKTDFQFEICRHNGPWICIYNVLSSTISGYASQLTNTWQGVFTIILIGPVIRGVTRSDLHAISVIVSKAQ